MKGGALALEAGPCFSLYCLLRACLRGQVLISAWMRWDSPGRLCDGWIRSNRGMRRGVALVPMKRLIQLSRYVNFALTPTYWFLFKKKLLWILSLVLFLEKSH